MTRDIIANKWIIGAIALLIIVAGACYLWYQHDTAPYRQEAAESAKLLCQRETTQKTDTVNKAEQAADAPAESSTPTAEKSINESTAEVENNTEAETQQPSDTPAANAEAKDVSMSPFGFGPYPEVPHDYPYLVNWESNFVIKHGMEHELLTRVRIKLWTQGIDAAGVTYGRGGLIYPVVRGVVYVTRSGDRITGVVLSHPGDDLGVFDAFWDAETPEEVDAAIQREMEGFTIDDLPAGLTAVDYYTASIDPHQFLDLP